MELLHLCAGEEVEAGGLGVKLSLLYIRAQLEGGMEGDGVMGDLGVSSLSAGFYTQVETEPNPQQTKEAPLWPPYHEPPPSSPHRVREYVPPEVGSCPR